jgi:hypothetical protein
VVFAVTMVIFLGLLAFTIDIAQVRVERAEAQGVADNASMAAAWATCQGRTEAQARAAGESVAAANGYGSAVVGLTGSDVWRTTIDTGVDTAFSEVIGGDSRLDTQVAADARAACVPGTPLPALWAGSTTCGDKTFVFSGSGNTINGGVHSNGDIVFGGDNDINGEGTYVGIAKDPDKIDWNPIPSNPTQGSVQPFPEVYNLLDFTPTAYGGTRSAAADYFFSAEGVEINQSWLQARNLYDSSTKTIQPGTYYSPKGFDLGSMTGARGTVTLVTPGQIKVSPSDLDVKPYEDGLLLFSDHYEAGKCDTFGIDISGSDNDWEGVVYAPRSQVKYQGSSGFTMSGSIIANTLYLGGSGFTLTSQSSTTPGDITVVLLK